MTLRRNLTLFLTLLFSIVMFHSQFLQAQDREIPTLTGEPVAPLLLSPVDGSQNIGRKPTFSWTETTGATRYTLVIKQNGNVKRRLKFDAAQICVDGVCTVDTSLLPDFKRLRKNRNYCWFVKVHTPEGNLKSIPARFRVNPQLRGVDCDITNPCTATPNPTATPTETETLTPTNTGTATYTATPSNRTCASGTSVTSPAYIYNNEAVDDGNGWTDGTPVYYKLTLRSETNRL